MSMKQIISLVALAAVPVMSGAQGELKTGISAENFDLTVAPGDDFYQYACGGWKVNNPLPEAYSRYGSFNVIEKENGERINAILNELLEGTYEVGTTEQKLGDFYKLAMDSVRRNAEGVAPVMPLINEIEAAETVDELKAIQLKYAAFGYGMPMRYMFGADEKNAKMNILNVWQGGITLGEKSYYLDGDSVTLDLMRAYEAYVTKMFTLFGFDEEQSAMKTEAVVQTERVLASVSKSRTELRDVEANYNKMTLKEFEECYPDLMLSAWLEGEGINLECAQDLVVGQPDFLAGANSIMGALSATELRAYMQWNVISSAATLLSDEVEQANFDFFGKKLSGRKQDYPRWQRATRMAESQMGEALGKLYVERYFPDAAKERMKNLVENLRASLAERIMAQDWMSDTTKQAALEKLATFYVKIGFPDKWKEMDELTIDPKLSFYENAMNCRLYWNNWRNEKTAGKPVDKDEWHMTPQTVNAYYNPTTNEICFPAGILQGPFFDMEADDAFNYGAIGVVIGHEMTHGFDDQGRHYDKEGNMTDWWTPADGEAFTKRADSYADFFSSKEALPGLNCNGRLTLGENLADHGGLMVAYNAFLKATAEHPLAIVDGLTPEQRFFIAYAGVWAQNQTDEDVRRLTKNDPHSIGMWRVNGALPHIDAWYDAFGITQEDKMYIPAEERLKLW